MESFYIELTGVANLSKEKVWKLTNQCVDSGFTAMGSYRFKVSKLDDLTLLGNKAACMWNVL